MSTKAKQEEKQQTEAAMLDIDRRITELYDDYLCASSITDRDKIASEIHSLEAKLIQMRQQPALSKNYGIKEMSTYSILKT